MAEPTVDPHVFVILGATGDLTRRKLLPALYRLRQLGVAGDRSLIVGAALPELDVAEFRRMAREALQEAGIRDDAEFRRWCDCCLFYWSVKEGTLKDFEALAEFIRTLEKTHGLPGNRVLYLALPPAAGPDAIEGMGQSGLTRSDGWVRVVMEKPFGHDHASARALNDLSHRYFQESQIYRIDHYLGKETVQNLLAFRFANPIFEWLWNRDRIDNVQITVAEDLGVGHRGAYYNTSGVIRDMVQNHLTQLMTVVGMEVPVTFEAEAIRLEKLKVLQSVEFPSPEDVVLGQYTSWSIDGQVIPGYREEPGVPPDSRTATYVALKVEINNWRWQGVPFYLRTGKRLPRKMTQIAVCFREAPTHLFEALDVGSVSPNKLLVNLQPSEGFALCFSVKSPGKPFQLNPHSLQFDYEKAFGALPEAYETLLRDILIGDQTLFVSAEFTELAWRLYDPLLRADLPAAFYTAGTWGPPEADRLLQRQGHDWQLGW